MSYIEYKVNYISSLFIYILTWFESNKFIINKILLHLNIDNQNEFKIIKYLSYNKNNNNYNNK